MKKIKLYAIGNYDNFNYYEFDKKQEVAEKLAEIFCKIFNIFWEFHEESPNKKKGWITVKKDVSKYKDGHEYINSRNNRVDLFYGDKKMFLIINCPQKNRLKFNDALMKIASMPKPKKFKK